MVGTSRKKTVRENQNIWHIPQTKKVLFSLNHFFRLGWSLSKVANPIERELIVAAV